MRSWLVVALAVLLAGCTADPAPDPAASSSSSASASSSTPARPAPLCATLREALDGGLAVLLVTFVGGLGPDGAITGPMANGTVEVLLGNETYGQVALDQDGCGSIALGELGRYTFRAVRAGSCTLDGEEVIVQSGFAGHVLRLTLSHPCA